MREIKFRDYQIIATVQVNLFMVYLLKIYQIQRLITIHIHIVYIGILKAVVRQINLLKMERLVNTQA